MTRNPWNGNSRGLEGLKQKTLGEYGYFLEHLIEKKLSNHLKNGLGFTGVFKPCLYKHDYER